MSYKHILFRADAREKILEGATALADAVRVTLGPKSKCVLIEKKWGEPLVCNDGVTIAKEIDLKDPEENLGAQMIREAAERTGDAVGDGTSTVDDPGACDHCRRAAQHRRRRQRHRPEARAGSRFARRGRRPLSRSRGRWRVAERRPQIATISAHNDATLGELVADAMEKVGAEGVVSVEEAKGTETRAGSRRRACRFDRGYLSPYFITDAEKMEAVSRRVAVLCCTRRRSARLKDLIPLLEQIAKAGKALLIVAEDVDGEALATLVVNKIRGVLALRRGEGARLRRPPQSDACKTSPF